MYPGSVNYQAAGGAWQPIDDTLVPGTGPGLAYQNKANAYALLLPSNLCSGVQISKAGVSAQFTLAGASGAPTAAGQTATYAGALPNVDVAYTAGNDTIEEQLILKSAAAQPVFVFHLSTGPGITAKANPSGGIDFADSSGHIRFSFAPPAMHDSSGAGPFGTSGPVSLKLGETNPNFTILRLKADPKWLADPARKFPVTIDPTTTWQGASQDCYIVGPPNGDIHYCPGIANLAVGVSTGVPGRTLAQFPVNNGGVPANAVVENAALGLYLYSESNSTPISIGAYQLTHSWNTNTTWNDYDGVNPWTAPGGDFNSSVQSTNPSVGGTGGWYYWFPTALTQSWINGTTANDGLILKEPVENQDNVVDFFSSEYANSSYWPFLQVIWEPWLGERSLFTYASQQLDDHLQAHVNVANGNLDLHQQALRIRGTGLNLAVDNVFNNESDIYGGMGYRWTATTGYDISLTIFYDGSAGFISPSGYELPFIKNPDGSGMVQAIAVTHQRISDGTQVEQSVPISV